MKISDEQKAQVDRENRGMISELSKKICDYAKEMGYRPNRNLVEDWVNTNIIRGSVDWDERLNTIVWMMNRDYLAILNNKEES